MRQEGWRYLHTTPHVYRPGSQDPHWSSENQSGNKRGHDSGKASHKITRSLFKLVRRTIQAVLLLLAFNIASDATGLSTTILSWVRGRPLNEYFFVPFTIVSKEQVSPTAFVLTVQPKHGRPNSKLIHFFRTTHVDSLSDLLEHPGRPKFYWPLFLRQPHSHGPALAAAWSHGLWSVEIRQPQLQVAREYTPLPPRRGENSTAAAAADDLETGALRFLIRRLDNGEVSTYLSRLRVGEDVDLRGPHLGYDVRARLGGAGGSVVFLAGGTGIAPALQVASALLDGDSSGDAGGVADAAPVAPPPDQLAISVIWANRQRADCEGCGRTVGVAGGAVVAQLAEMQARHPGKFTVRCTVDEERAFITGADIAGATATATTRGRVSSAGDCRLHSQKWVAARAGRELAGEEEECVCEAPDGRRGAGGKNLMFVSGPDGFIDAYAGPKRWAAGQELQGAVSGLLGELRRRDPGSWQDWLVLKL